MKITIVLGAFLPVPAIMGGAVEKAWFALAQEFARCGHEVVQISRAVPAFPRSEIVGGVRHLRVPGFDTPKSLVWLKFLDLIYSLRVRSILPVADIVVTNTFWLPMILRSEKRGRVYVHVARFPKGQMRFYAHAARLQTVSTSVANAIVQEAPRLRDKVSVVPYPRPENSNDRGRAPLGARAKIILYVGRIHPEKGLDLLLHSLSRSQGNRLAGWRLVVVGPAEAKFGGGGEPYLDHLKKAAEMVAIPVEWRGAIFDPDELAATYDSARIFIYPSLAETGETFGVAPLEAMANGCAVLVSSLACFQDFIRDGETGFTFDHRTKSSAITLREKLEAVSSDEASLARVADAGYRKSLEYSLPAVAEKYLTDFRALLRHA